MFHVTAILSAYAPWAEPKTRCPGLYGHPDGIGELAAIRPANSAPRVNGNGGWFWYLPWACKIYTGLQKVNICVRHDGWGTYVEEIQACAVNLHHNLILSWVRFWCVMGDRNLGGVSVRLDDCCAHYATSERSERQETRVGGWREEERYEEHD